MFRSTVLCTVFVVGSLVAPVWAGDWATDMFKTTSHDFGSVARGAKAEFEFPLSNIYLEEVHIAGVRSSCGCTSPRITKADLKTYETGSIVAHINTDRFLGSKGATITVTFDKPRYAEVQLQVRCYIRSDVVFEPGNVDLGEVSQGQTSDRTVNVSYAGRDDWRILDVRSDNPHLSTKLTETSRGGGRVTYALSVHLGEKAPPGYVNDQLVLMTNDQRMPQVPLAVDGRVLSGLTISPSTLFMGVLKPGQEIEKKLIVRGEKPFRVLSVQCDDEHFQADTSAGQEPKTLHLIPITYVAGDAPGKVTGKLQIETDLGTTGSELPAYAVIATEE